MKTFKLIFSIMLLLMVLPIAAQPEPPIRFCAEWEPAIGTLIRYPLGIPYELVIELAADDSLYILVEDQSQQNIAEASFQNHGVNMENCHFLQILTNSHWTRDWGPQFMFIDGYELAILDPEFDGYPWVPGGRDRLYDDDDAVNAALGEYLGLPVFYLPAYLTGGNIMTDGCGNAFSTQQMLDENTGLGWNSYEFFFLLQEYAGIQNYHILPNIENYGIQHIDCGAKLLSEEKVLIKRLPEWHPEYERLEELTTAFSELETCFGNEYEIIRIDCPSYSGNDCAAYTNSLILNNKVLVPLFGIPADAEAIETYEEAMPGYQISGFFDGSWYYYDALHCRTHEIIDPEMLYLQHTPFNDYLPAGDSLIINLSIHACSGAELNYNHLYFFWRNNPASPFSYQVLQQTTSEDSFFAVIPPQLPAAEIEYYFYAEDMAGKSANLPRTAPSQVFSFQIDPYATTDVVITSAPVMKVFPNPFNPSTTLSLYLKEESPVSIKVFNLRGQRINTVCQGHLKSGRHELIWKGDDYSGNALPSGVYLITVQSKAGTAVQKALLLK